MEVSLIAAGIGGIDRSRAVLAVAPAARFACFCEWNHEQAHHHGQAHLRGHWPTATGAVEHHSDQGHGLQGRRVPGSAFAGGGAGTGRGRSGRDGGVEVLVVGGANVYEQALPHATRLYLTVIDGQFPGDAWFPLTLLKGQDWQITEAEYCAADQKNDYPHLFGED